MIHPEVQFPLRFLTYEETGILRKHRSVQSAEPTSRACAPVCRAIVSEACDKPSQPTMEDVKRQTQSVYKTHAAAWDAQRNRSLFERPWLDRLLARTSPNDTALDVGCGAGEPIARYILERDRRVCGVDFAEPMLAMARTRFPGARWINADMRDLELGECFAGVIAWDSFFHLSPDEQRSTIPRLARHVASGGCLLLTVGPSASERIGSVSGEPVYHASLSIDEYEERLRGVGMEVEDFVPEDPGCAGHSVLFVVRLGS
jgi:SAM-dependent methyltransferase